MDSNLSARPVKRPGLDTPPKADKPVSPENTAVAENQQFAVDGSSAANQVDGFALTHLKALGRR